MEEVTLQNSYQFNRKLEEDVSVNKKIVLVEPFRLKKHDEIIDG
jgi:hypothetical protein